MVLVRHGESTWVAEGLFQGQADPPLSPAGQRQAALVADRLRAAHRAPALPVPSGPPLEIVHSPLRRTAETAATIQSALRAASRPPGAGVTPDLATGADVPRRAEPGFLEIAQGEWEGRSGDEIQATWPKELAGWRRDPLSTWAPGGESVAEVDARVRAALGRLLGEIGGRGNAAVGHRSQVLGYGDARSKDPWSILVGHDGALKVALLAMLDLPLDGFWRFPFALCGISVIEIRAGRPRLRAHNLTDHLAPLDDEPAEAIEADRNRAGAL